MKLPKPALFELWRNEFKGYDRQSLQSDLIAGLTVAAVALPLALAFGVASGSTPAAGLVTAIVGGFLIGLLGGAPFQISGPTGAMSAVLITVGHQQGMRGIWLAGLMAGVLILLIGLLNLGRVVYLIPAPVITGFTSGIALVIFIGQIDTFLGISTPSQDRAAAKLAGYFREPLPPVDWHAIAAGLIVIAVMLAIPLLLHLPRLPAALIGIAVATGVTTLAGWDASTIGTIPSSLVPEDRLIPNRDDLDQLDQLLGAALAIALLGSIESLLCGVVGGRMTGKRLAVKQELIAQGVGNLALPFVGGVPATAAIARTSVGVKAGGATRLVSVIHSGSLLLGAVFLGSAIGRIPLSALAGVLFVTSWRMNEWHAIRYYWHHRLPSAIAAFLVTMVATVLLDLTQAIVVGLLLSLAVFLRQTSQLTVSISPVDWNQAGHRLDPEPDAQVVYVTGPLFFGSVNQFVERVEERPFARNLILSMRGVPSADVSSVQAIEHLWSTHVAQGGTLFLTGVQPQVRSMFERVGLVRSMGEEHFLWSADQAIARVAAAALAGPQAIGTEVPPPESLDEMPLGISTA